MAVKIIAESGASHRKSYTRCIALIHASRMAGADAIKFSLFKPDEMAPKSDEPPFIVTKEGPWQGKSLYELYEQSSLCYDWISDLKTATRAAGMEFIVSVYHPNTVPLLHKNKIETVKIASFELGYLSLLEAISEQECVKHVILSTGGATVDEIETAMSILAGKKVTLLHCVSSYPAALDEMNILTMADMGGRFKTEAGLSDHTTGIAAAVVAASMGASIIEKHIKLDDEGLDASFAVFPDRFATMSGAIREVERAMGKVEYPGKKTYHRDWIDGEYWRKVW
ncbi:MAG: N-acetylneuraminate synthase family protein [Chloroflexi bacterium]|nr:N-acetylneuraminate synthase family protein [Chloroflexota bacterium]